MASKYYLNRCLGQFINFQRLKYREGYQESVPHKQLSRLLFSLEEFNQL
jgi:hypothetical protein